MLPDMLEMHNKLVSIKKIAAGNAINSAQQPSAYVSINWASA